MPSDTFVVYSTAMQVGILTGEANAILTAIVICSMVLTPLMVIVHDRFAPKAIPSMEGVEEAKDLQASILLIGFGRFGQVVSQPLLARGHTVSIIETDPQMIRDAGAFGFKVWYGDGSRLDILRSAGAAEASLIVVAPDDTDAATKAVELLKHEFPLVPVLARARNRAHALDLIEAGADFQMRETFESAMTVGREALIRLGDTPEAADELVASVRASDVKRLEIQIAEGVDARPDMLHVNANSKPAH